MIIFFIYLRYLYRLTKFSFKAGLDGSLYKLMTTRPDHNTGSFVPFPLREVCGFLNIPC